MLLLTRMPGEGIEIQVQGQGDTIITLTVVDVMSNGVVKLGFEAPNHVRFIRDNARRRQPRRHSSFTQERYDGQETQNPYQPTRSSQADGSAQTGLDPEADEADEISGNR